MAMAFLTILMDFLVFIPIYLAENLGLEPGQAGMASTVFPSGMFVALILCGVYYSRLSKGQLVWVHGSPLTKAVVKNQIPEAAEQNRGLVRSFYRFLDGGLATRDYIAGDTFTIADILALTTVDFAAKLVEVPFDPALAHLSARPSAISSARARTE